MEPSDINAIAFPISIKGIVFINNKIILLKNEREEWELPGGKLELGEIAEDCVIREIKEELNIDCEIDYLIDVWMYNILNKVNVFIVTYLCKNLELDIDRIRISNEHKEVGFFTIQEIENLKMPTGYKNSIKKCVHGK